MDKQIKTTEFNVRLQGTRYEYYTLKCFLDGKEVKIHTAKDKSYILRLKNDWETR